MGDAAERIAKLIPRLASTFDPEVVATVRAIQRILVASGQDWHMVAHILATHDRTRLAAAAPAGTESRAPQPRERRPVKTRQAPRWPDLSDAQRRAWIDVVLGHATLVGEEVAFLEGVREMPVSTAQLSDRELRRLDRLLAMTWRRASRIMAPAGTA